MRLGFLVYPGMQLWRSRDLLSLRNESCPLVYVGGRISGGKRSASFPTSSICFTGICLALPKQNATKGADAIICLSGGRTTRVPESLRLWNRGFAKQLFVTAEKAKNKEFQKLELSHLGFASAVTERMDLNATWQLLPSLSGGATSTFDEAEDALALSLEKKWNRIIIVTDEFHTQRAHLCFSKNI